MKGHTIATYRWNDDLLRLEFWDGREWVASTYSRTITEMASTGYITVAYDDTWCEPVRE